MLLLLVLLSELSRPLHGLTFTWLSLTTNRSSRKRFGLVLLFCLQLLARDCRQKQIGRLESVQEQKQQLEVVREEKQSKTKFGTCVCFGLLLSDFSFNPHSDSNSVGIAQ